MVSELIRIAKYFPGILQRTNQIRDKAPGAPEDVYNLMTIKKMIKNKLVCLLMSTCVCNHSMFKMKLMNIKELNGIFPIK